MEKDTLEYCMKISIEAEEHPPREFIEEAIGLKARKKNFSPKFDLKIKNK